MLSLSDSVAACDGLLLDADGSVLVHLSFLILGHGH